MFLPPAFCPPSYILLQRTTDITCLYFFIETLSIGPSPLYLTHFLDYPFQILPLIPGLSGEKLVSLYRLLAG